MNRHVPGMFLLLTLLLSWGLAQDAVPADQPQSLLIEEWSGSAWIGNYQEQYGYTGWGAVSDTTRSLKLGSTWYLDWQTLVSFDGQGNRTRILRQRSEGENWHELWRWDHIFDLSDQRTSSTYLEHVSDVWQPRKRKLYSYLDNGQLQAEIHQVMVGSDWLNDRRDVRQYGDENQLVQLTRQRWNYDSEVWEDLSRETFEYNTEGQQTIWIGSVLEGSVWEDTWREIRVYDENGRLISVSWEFQWNEEWLVSDRDIFTYFPTGKIQTRTTQFWNIDDGLWADDRQHQYSYDAQDRPVQRVDLFMDSDETWVQEGRNTWTYAPVSIDDVLQPGVFTLSQNFPNPFNPETVIRFFLEEQAKGHLVIYDVLGREVVALLDEEITAGQHEICWHGQDMYQRPVESGLYLARLTVHGQTRSIKMMLLR